MAGIEVLVVRFLEPGERAKLHIRVFEEPGVTIAAEGLRTELSGSDPSVLQVEGDEIVGVGPGSATVTVTVTGLGDTPMVKTLEIGVISGSGGAWKKAVTGRPRILFTEEERLRLKARVASPKETALGIDVEHIWQELAKEGDAYLSEAGFRVTYLNAPDVIDVSYPLIQPKPLPNPAGYVDYPFWTMYSRRIEERLVTLSILYALTEERKYAERAKGMLLDLSRYQRWYEFPERGAEGNLSNAHFTLGVATAYDTIHDTLTAEERVRIRTAILEKGLRPMSIEFGNGDQHNIIVAKQVAMMIGALSIADEEPAAAKYIDQTYQYMKTYLDLRIDSEETEGLMYNNIAAKHLAQAAVALKKSTGDGSLIAHKFLTEVVPEQFFYFQAAGGEPTFANLSDCHPKLDLSYMMSLLAENASNGAAMWYVQQYEANKQPVLLNLSRGTEPIAPDDYFRDAKSKVFPRIGWASLRSGWKAKDHMLGFTSSPSARGHNHLDQNHYVMNVAGEWLITDPGYQDYRPGPKNEFTDGSVGHNVLMVNGKGQTLRGSGKLQAWHTSPGFDYVRGDATATYEGAIRQWKRTIVHVGEAFYVVYDDIVLGDPADRVELLLHTKSEIRQGGGALRPGAAADALQPVVFQGERAAVRVQTWSSQPADIAVTEYPGAEEYGPYLTYRLSADAEGRTQLVTLLTPCPDGADAAPPAALDVKREEDGVTLMIDGGRERIRIGEEVYRLQG